MKRFILSSVLVVFVAVLCNNAFAYDFSAVCESGQTLYYNITSSIEPYTVEVARQDTSEPYYDTNPVGNLAIPENVTFNDVMYSVTSIADSTFYNCSELTSVIIPNSVIRIGNMAFGKCRGLTSVTIPESVERIDNWAFKDCQVLATVNFNATNCTFMGSVDYPVFQNCYANTTINIGNGVSIIPNYAFMYVKGNGSLYIPNSVTRIGKRAFFSCNRFTSVVIGTSVSEIDSCAFLECTSLESIVIESDNNVYDSRDNCNAIIETSTNNLIVGCKNSIIPNSVTSIGEHAFGACSITSISMPNSVTSIGDYAFAHCEVLTEVNMGDSVSIIGNRAFSGCIRLTNLTISSSVEDIGNYAFASCYALASVMIPNSVRSIGEHAFDWCRSIISLTIPNSVTNIGQWAFNFCTGLTSVTIPNSITRFQAGTFENCSSLTSISIPNSVNYIGESAFKGCSGLTSLVIPNSVRLIDFSAFEDCSSLTSVTIPNSVTSIGAWAFEDCTSLTSIVIPNSIQIINDGLFWGCTGLTTITFPKSIRIIGDHAFYECTNLRTVKIPSSVTRIGTDAFLECTNINAIYSFAVTPPEIESHSFDGDLFYNYDNNVVVYVPCEAVDNYESANYWSYFRNIQGNRDQMLDVESTDSLMGTANVVETPDCENRFAVIEATANDGYAFLEWNDGNTENPRTIEVISDTTYIATFAIARTVTIESSNTDMGYVIGSGVFAEGAEVEITAVPYEGYRFDHWVDVDNPSRDFNTDNPRTIVVSTDVTYMAVFTDVVGIEDNGVPAISVFPNPTTDILNITSSETISEIEIVNVMVQVVKRIEVNADNVVCDVEDLKAGVYVVRIRTIRQAQGAALRKFVKE